MSVVEKVRVRSILSQCQRVMGSCKTDFSGWKHFFWIGTPGDAIEAEVLWLSEQ
jgi:hypothetical protein